MSEEEVLIDVAAIGEKYEDKGYFRRLGEMFSGLGKPHDTPEYKKARFELQRQAAPLIAFVSVILFVIVLVVVTALQKDDAKGYEITVQEQEEEPPPPDEQEEVPPDPPPDPEPQPMDDLQTPVDRPADPSPVSNITPMPSPPSKTQTVKPAEANTVAKVNSPVKFSSMVSSRNPGSIGAATGGGAGYGDANTEAAVLKVLWWLKETQRTDPSNPDLGYWGGGSSTLANTALAVLTYLAHGEHEGARESPYRKDFGPVVTKALNYLVSCVQGGSDGKPHMKGADGNEYAFLIATYALCEAFGMTKNADLRDPAQRCLQRIIEGQSATGGWDYKINPKSNRDDVSFAGWALQALKAGKLAGVFPNDDPLHEKLEKECLPKAIRCLKTRNFTQGGFSYVAAQKNPTGLTATGCLAMQLLGYGKEKEVSSALEYMRGWKPAWRGKDVDAKSPGDSAQYYCYYATQCKYQAGMKQGATQTDTKTWQDWNKAMKALYTVPVPEGEPGLHDVATPARDHNGREHKQGFYTNKDAHTSRPVMDTCLAALQLMVYYRYLPTTQTSAAEESSSATTSVKKDKSEVEVEVDF